MHSYFVSQRLNPSRLREDRIALPAKPSAIQKLRLAALVIMLSPVLAWLLLGLLVIGGCTGSPGTGVTCPPIFGIDFHAMPTYLLLFSIKGLAISVPLGSVLLLSCHYLSQTRKR